MIGTVQSGEGSGARRLAGATVTLFEATEGAPVAVGSAKTGGDGQFSLAPSHVTSGGIFYASAILASGVRLVAIVGPRAVASITINELTTVAAGFSLAQFTRDGAIAGSSFGLRVAAGMNDNLVSTATGASSNVLLSSPNGDETIALRSTRALANLLAACVEDAGSAAALYQLTTPPGGAAPADTLQAIVNIALQPASAVGAIYQASKRVERYLPALEAAPDAWTIAVKVNDSGSETIPFGGPGNIVFDRDGYAWITNNVVQGTTKSTTGIMVLKPDGRPADGALVTPASPITGGGLLGPGFGIDIDPRGTIWVGSFGWGRVNPSPTGNGSVSQFDPLGRPISPPGGYQGGTERAQGTVSDQQGNIWICSFENNRVVVFPDGDPSRALWYQDHDKSRPFDIAIAGDGGAWVTNSGGLAPRSKSSVAKYALQGGAVAQQFCVELGHSLKGLSLDSAGNAWIASGGDDCVYLLDPSGKQLGKFAGGGITSPWSATVDGDDDVWVANFGPMELGHVYSNAGITKLAGCRRSNPGAPLSPATGYTLPSGGSQVLLHDGQPLYGEGKRPSFDALMRQTNCVIDQAGNVWTTNNWKPSFDKDVTSNPGGDAIVIYVGLAKPPKKKH